MVVHRQPGYDAAWRATRSFVAHDGDCDFPKRMCTCDDNQYLADILRAAEEEEETEYYRMYWDNDYEP